MSNETNLPAPQGQFLIYADGASQLQVRLVGNTVWLTQKLISELYGVTVPTVNEHLAGIYEDGELNAGATIRSFRIVQREGTRDVSRNVEHYSLDAILAVGYRVRSARGTAFRQWATARLSELLVKGFTMDDERIKAGRTLGADYFDELLARIRDIRSSERMFYQKITDIYATSIDYDPSAEASKLFFQTVQNKLHWAAHGHTAAEVIASRASAAQPHMGLTNWKNAPSGPVRKPDVAIAKNYLTEEELKALNLIVSAYLDFAELQALNRKPMPMREWIAKLDDFIRITERDYARRGIDPVKMAGLINLIADIGFKGSRDKARDTLGRVYEYFLGNFAAAEGKLGGEFYTPRSVVRVLVEMLEPYAGRVYDPACGSGGMFVQSEKFAEAHGGNKTDVSIFGQESTPTTWRLAHMNLAIHSIEANLGPAPADTFLRDAHPDLKADFVLGNPPFNVSDYSGPLLRGDKRWTFGEKSRRHGETFATRQPTAQHGSRVGPDTRAVEWASLESVQSAGRLLFVHCEKVRQRAWRPDR